MKTMQNVLVLLIMLAQFNEQKIAVNISWYDPARCETEPINCFDPVYWWRMAAGHDARDYYYNALACPIEFPIGTIFKLPEIKYGIPEKEWVCLDRGGAIKSHIDDDGQLVIDLDLLVDRPIVTGLLDGAVVVEDAVVRMSSNNKR